MKALILGLALASGALASPAPAQLEERYPMCGDGCYGQVRQNQLLGYRSRPACKEAFQSTITPCTVTTTSSVTWAGYQYGYKPCGPNVTTTTAPATLTTATTTYTPLTVLYRRDREPVQHCPPTTRSTTAVPTYFPSCRNVAQYSSACSCLGQTHSAITLPTPTSTAYHVGCSTSTITSYTTVATVYSTTETDTVTAIAPTCSAVVTAAKADGSGSKVYAMKYHGWGKISDPDESRYNIDRDHPPDIEYLGDSDDDCDMIQQCANMAYSNTDEYYMFDLHYKDSEWVCVQYYQGSGDSSNFDVDDPDAHKVYGYQVAYYG